MLLKTQVFSAVSVTINIQQLKRRFWYTFSNVTDFPGMMAYTPNIVRAQNATYKTGQRRACKGWFACYVFFAASL
jgi:hypothetical protein